MRPAVAVLAVATAGVVGLAVVPGGPRDREPELRLLWFEGRPTQPVPGGAVVVDDAGRVLVVDGRLEPRFPVHLTGGRHIAAASAGPDGGLWLADGQGTLWLVDSAGQVRAETAGPHRHPMLAADPEGGRVWSARSPRRFAYAWDSVPAPVAVEIGSAGAGRRVGDPVVPSHVLLTDLANAGHLAVGNDAVYYAPFIRDEIVAFRTTGDTLWVARRGLPHGTPEPRFEVAGGRALIDYHPVNLGLALGPDGMLYALSTPARTTSAGRLDVLDPATGRVLRTLRLSTALPTLAADARGRIRVLDPDRVLQAVPPAAREAFPAFSLPTLEGERLHSARLGGKVVLLNFWASWCTPCREEMPALAALAGRMGDTAFALVALNEDEDVGDAREFLRRSGLELLVPLGRGALKARYHYPGLPYTVLLDRQGRVVQRWIGYGGPAQIERIEHLVRREIGRPEGSGSSRHHPAVQGGKS